MICCKIITNFDNGDFNELISKIAVAGDFLFANNYLFFCDTESDISEKKIKSLLKRSGYQEFYINVYDQKNPPKETDDINAWLLNKIMKMNYNQCERENQKVFQEISKGLDLLEVDIQNIKNTALQKKEQKNDTTSQ